MWFSDDDRASWAFVEGSISVSASIVMAYAISQCDRCGGWPVIGFLKRLTEQEDGVLIMGMALLFPTAIAFYLGGKMVFGAYREYRSWREARMKEHEAALASERAEGRQEGVAAERIRLQRELAERGIALPPEAEKILSGEPNMIAAERARVRREFAARGIALPPEAEKILSGESDVIAAERARVRRQLAARGIALPPEAEKILSGESEGNSPAD